MVRREKGLVVGRNDGVIGTGCESRSGCKVLNGASSACAAHRLEWFAPTFIEQKCLIKRAGIVLREMKRDDGVNETGVQCGKGGQCQNIILSVVLFRRGDGESVILSWGARFM